MNRTCGDCQLCCVLMPIKSFNKPANQRCHHQSHARGCKVHGTPDMPTDCRVWNCRWVLGAPGTEDLSRPDRAGYVLDVAPDFITVTQEGGSTNVQVMQVWCDPKRPESHKDPRLRAYIADLAEQGIAALIRFSTTDAFVLAAPKFTGNGWQEIRSSMAPVAHTAADIAAALGPDYYVKDLRENAGPIAAKLLTAGEIRSHIFALVLERIQAEGRDITDISDEDFDRIAGEAAADLKLMMETSP
jgi:hypothetical protein